MTKHTPEYTLTEDGRVWSKSGWRGIPEREMKPTPDAGGYLYVRLTIGGKRKKFMVHQMVANKYVGSRPSPAHEVRHLNGIRTDNRPGNLAWGTRLENANDREAHGNTSRGHKHSAAVLRGIQHARAVIAKAEGGQ